MKRLLLTLITALLMSSTTWAQEDIFKKFADHEGVTTIYISKKMFNMITDYYRRLGFFVSNDGIINIYNSEVHNIIEKVHSLQRLSCTNKNVIDEIRKTTADYFKKDDKYELLMKIKANNEHTSVYIKEEKKENRYIFLTDNPDEFTFVLFKGEVTREELQDALKPLTYSP